MKRETFAEEANTFADSVETARRSFKVDRNLLRKLDYERRRLIRSMMNLCRCMTDDQLYTVAEYLLLITM